MDAPQPARIVLSHPAGWIACGLGAGLSPWAPGTIGSLVALVPWWFWLRHLEPGLYLAWLALAFALGTWAAGWVIRKSRIEDPSVVVWDEFVGQWLALLLAPPGWQWPLAAFVLFRLFDIWKPWPVRWADRELHGGFGAMLDDVLAGLYALLCVQGAYWLLR